MKLLLSVLFFSLVTPSLSQASSLDCREGDHYWAQTKGYRFDLKNMKVQQYKDSGSTLVGHPAYILCSQNEVTLICEGQYVTLTVNELNQTKRQKSSDFSDAIGSIVGGSGKYVDVVMGSLTTTGLFFQKTYNVVCAVRNY